MNKGLKGFSIVEALIVVAILSVVLGAIFGIAYKAQVSFDAEKRFTETSQHARIAMDEIVRYVRQAGNDPFPKDGFSYPAVELLNGNSNQIVVRSDITGSYPNPGSATGDPDHLLNSPMEDVTIQYVPNQNPGRGTGACLYRTTRQAGGFRCWQTTSRSPQAIPFSSSTIRPGIRPRSQTKSYPLK